MDRNPSLPQSLEPNTPVTPEEIERLARTVRDQIAVPQVPPLAANVRLLAVTADFVELTLKAADMHDGVAKTVGGVETRRAEVDEMNRWTAAQKELNALAATVDLVVRVLKSRVGRSALQTYRICQQLARGGDPALQQQVDDMRRVQPYRRKKAVKPEDAEKPAPPVTKA